MANHPNRSKQPRTTYSWIGNLQLLIIGSDTPENLKGRAGKMWRSGPVHNNRLAPMSWMTDSINEHLDYLFKYAGLCQTLADREKFQFALLSAAPGDELSPTENGEWRIVPVADRIAHKFS